MNSLRYLHCQLHNTTGYNEVTTVDCLIDTSPETARQTIKRTSTGLLAKLTLGVVSLGPVVPGPGLAEHEVVWPEDLTEGSGPDGVHGAGLQIYQDGPGHVLPAGGLIVVDVDPLQLELRGPSIGASGVDAVLIRDDLPELET